MIWYNIYLKNTAMMDKMQTDMPIMWWGMQDKNDELRSSIIVNQKWKDWEWVSVAMSAKDMTPEEILKKLEKMDIKGIAKKASEMSGKITDMGNEIML